MMHRFYLDLKATGGRSPQVGDILPNPERPGAHMEVMLVLGNGLPLRDGTSTWHVELRDADPEVYTLEGGSWGEG